MTTPARPNIILIYADDLGFGDIGCFGASRIPTPNLDRLAASGLRCTDAHSTAATCTPARYSLLTGSYPWRNPRATILSGDDPALIAPGTYTLPEMLRRAGYTTHLVGKWHLGLGEGTIDWNGRIGPGPLEVGFDHAFMMAATNDRVPCVYLDDQRVLGLDPADPITVTYREDDPPLPGELPQGRHHPELLRMPFSHQHDEAIVNGVSRIGRMAGGTSALWCDETMAETFLERAKRVVSQGATSGQPFFLYYALHQPHVPRLPSPRFTGSTGLGPRGDVIAELDWCVGELLTHLDATGQRDHTIVWFSSDNGPVLDDGYHDQAVECCGDHRPAGPLRGGKYSLYEGGTRVPTIISWPDVIQPGESTELLNQVDLLASFARLVGQALPADAAPDSIDCLDAWLGRGPSARTEMLCEGSWCSDVLRQNSLVYIPPHEIFDWITLKGIEDGRSEQPQLYDLSQDVAQIRNLASERPDVVAAMQARVREIHIGSGTRRQSRLPQAP